MLTEIAILVVLLGLSGFFSAAEIAIFSISEIRVRRLVKEKRHGAKTLQKIKSESNMLLVTILIGNNIVNTAIAAIGTIISINNFEPLVAGIVIALLTIVIIVFGEILPKSISYSHSEKMALASAEPIRLLMIVFWPISKLFSKINEAFIESRDGKGSVTEEDVKIALSMGEESGSIEREEKIMIHNVFEFSDTSVSQIMTRRDDIVAVSIDASVEEAVNMMAKRSLSRLPVYDKEEENIVGFVYIKDLIRHFGAGKMKSGIRSDINPVLFVPETQKLDSLIEEMRIKRLNMAVVIDENGLVQGIVTMEDLVEEIFGEIYDETDQKSRDIRRTGKNEFIVTGKAKLIDLRKKTGLKLGDSDVNTVAGFIMKELEHMPSGGESFETERAVITVMKATDKEIVKVRIQRK